MSIHTQRNGLNEWQHTINWNSNDNQNSYYCMNTMIMENTTIMIFIRRDRERVREKIQLQVPELQRGSI